jgi:Flp pilus assembly pilin Flp
MTSLLYTLITLLQARLDRTDKGEVSLEYVLVGGMAAVGIVAGMGILFPAASTWFQDIATEIGSAF